MEVWNVPPDLIILFEILTFFTNKLSLTSLINVLCIFSPKMKNIFNSVKIILEGFFFLMCAPSVRYIYVNIYISMFTLFVLDFLLCFLNMFNYIIIIILYIYIYIFFFCIQKKWLRFYIFLFRNIYIYFYFCS